MDVRSPAEAGTLGRRVLQGAIRREGVLFLIPRGIATDAMTIPLLAQIGIALYGEGNGWQSRLAEDLGVNERTMLRWLAAESAIPPGVWAELANIAFGRAKEIADLIPTIQAKAEKA